jgi:hypothetical protein
MTEYKNIMYTMSSKKTEYAHVTHDFVIFIMQNIVIN